MQNFLKCLLCFLLIAAVKPMASAQNGCLHNPTAEQIKHLTQTREARQNYDPHANAADNSPGIDWVPIQFHECVPTVGSLPTLYYGDYFDPRIADLNALFKPLNIQFYECAPVHVFPSPTLHSFDVTEEPLLSAYDVPNVINIYYFANVTNGNVSYCGYSYLPPSVDRIIMNKSCIGSGTKEIFLHEMGHYLSLYHTHGKSNTVRTDELVNGSNCSTAGDDVCDTPADPQLFNSGFLTNCIYTGTMLDANGDQYQPDPRNYMSYSNVNCQDAFSPQQMNRMAYAVQYDRAYLTGCPHPNNCEVAITTLPYTFDFETGMENWSNIWIEPEFMVPMIIGSGPTPTPNSGPDAAFSGNNYLFLEGTPPSSNYTAQVAVIRSPCLDLRAYAAPKMSFRYHAYGSQMIDVLAQASTDGGISWYEFPESLLYYSAAGNQGNQWNTVICDLTAFKSFPSIQVRIGADTWRLNAEDDFAIDYIQFYNDNTTTCQLAVIPVVENVNCNGNSDGEVNLQVTGNSGIPTYIWSNGATTASIEQLAQGTYTVTVTDAIGCTASAVATVTQPAILQVASAVTNVSIPGQSTGAIAVTATGGTPPYYYFWNNNATTQTITGLAAGTYTVTVIDSRDCPATATATVTQPTVVCSSYYGSFPYTNSLESGFDIFERVLGYQTNWVRRQNNTPNPNTGPSSAHHGNFYAHLNSTNFAMTAVLRTKHCLNLTAVTNPVIEFYYHMFGANMGTLYVEVSTDNEATWTTAWSLSGNQGNQWTKASVNLQPYNTGATKIRFRGVTGIQTSDMAIDALYIGSAGVNQFAPFVSINPTVADQALRQDKLYPNPTEGLFTFETEASQPFESVEVYDQTGKIVWQSEVASTVYQIDLTQRPVGVYYVRGRSGKEVIINKLLILRK